MGNKNKFVFFILYAIGVATVAVLLIHGSNIAVLNPKGMIASKERRLIITATLLMLIVVIPVFILTFFIAWKYRASNTKAKYSPDWDHHRGLEFIWWAIPALIIAVLAVVAWRASHQLDPFRKIDSAKKPLTVEVVALEWKWLFIYPEQKIATVNYLQFPEKTPIDFKITADAPMNSFWIPQLGGQVYAMSGMATQLHLMADGIGSYNGVSANLSGKGFAGMKFVAKSTSRTDFDQWVQLVQLSRNSLSFNEYNKLAQPSENNPASYYSVSEGALFDRIVMKYMHSSHQANTYVGAE